jgi:hypothetical protein
MASIVISGLKKIYCVTGYSVYDPMLLGEPARPGSREKMLEGFRFPDS